MPKLLLPGQKIQDEDDGANCMAFCRCPACQSSKIADQAVYRAAVGPFLELRRKLCVQCGLGFAWPMPSQKSLLNYNQKYFEKTGQKAEGKRADAFTRGLAKIRVQYLERHLRGALFGGSSCLEIGPGEGYLAEIILRKHPRLNYLGIETDTSCHPGLKKKGVMLLDSSTALPPLDLVILSHVLEHVTDPLKLLKKIRSSLRPDGLIFIEVPCQDFLHKRIDEPHLLFFDKRSMEALLHQAGFGMLQISYHGPSLKNLVANKKFFDTWQTLRARLVGWGLHSLLGSMEDGLEPLTPLERAMVKPWLVHRESMEPAWWLRAVAIKP